MFDDTGVSSSKFRIYKSLIMISKKFLAKKIQKFLTNQEAGNKKSRDSNKFDFI